MKNKEEKMRICLKCGVEFLSTDKSNRWCKKCDKYIHDPKNLHRYDDDFVYFGDWD